MTDPEELRTRAASIFERLRKGGSSIDEPPGDEDTPMATPPGPAPEEEAGTTVPTATSMDQDTTISGPTTTPADTTTSDCTASAETTTDQASATPGTTTSPVTIPETANQSGTPPADTTHPGTTTTTDQATATPGTATQSGTPPVDTMTSPAAAIAPATPPAPAPVWPGEASSDRMMTAASPSDGIGADRAAPSWGPPDEAAMPGPRTEHAMSAGSNGIGLPADLPVLGDPDRARAPGWRGSQTLPRVMAIANQKGGVGKTTTAVNLGAALAELGYRVLVIDLDPQGNATTGLGINARNLDASVYDVLLHDVPIEDCIEPTSLRNLFVVPATIDLAGAEIELVPVFSRELRLRRAIESVSDDFDFTLIDCPPSLGLLTVNGLAAASEVVVPIQCEYYALEGLGQLLRNVNLVKVNLNARLEVTTIILTMFDARTRLAEQVVNEVRAHFGDRVCRNVVPRTVRLSEAPSFGQPIIVFDSSSRGAIAYRELAKEVSGGAPQRVG